MVRWIFLSLGGIVGFMAVVMLYTESRVLNNVAFVHKIMTRTVEKEQADDVRYQSPRTNDHDKTRI